MSEINLGSIAIQCPKCGCTQLSKGDIPETEDIGTCSACGERFSLQAEIRKIQEAVKKGIADAIRKALK